MSTDVTRGYNIYLGNTDSYFNAFDPGFRNQIYKFQIDSLTDYSVKGYDVFPYTVCDVGFRQSGFQTYEKVKESESTTTSSQMGIGGITPVKTKETTTKKSNENSAARKEASLSTSFPSVSQNLSFPILSKLQQTNFPRLENKQKISLQL